MQLKLWPPLLLKLHHLPSVLRAKSLTCFPESCPVWLPPSPPVHLGHSAPCSPHSRPLILWSFLEYAKCSSPSHSRTLAQPVLCWLYSSFHLGILDVPSLGTPLWPLSKMLQHLIFRGAFTALFPMLHVHFLIYWPSLPLEWKFCESRRHISLFTAVCSVPGMRNSPPPAHKNCWINRWISPLMLADGRLPYPDLEE